MTPSDHLTSSPIQVISDHTDHPIIDSLESQGFEVTSTRCEPTSFHRPLVLVDLSHNEVKAILATAATHNAILLIDEAQSLDVNRMMLLMDREAPSGPLIGRHDSIRATEQGLATIIADMEKVAASKDRAHVGYDYETANHHGRAARHQKHAQSRRR